MNDNRTEKKVIQGGLWGSVTIVVVWAIGAISAYLSGTDGIVIPTEVAQSLTVVMSSLAAYYTS